MMKYLITLLIFVSFSTHSKVIYKHTDFKDPFGQKIVKLSIEDNIERGDYEEFRKAIIEINQNNYRVFEDSVFLNSYGGTINEAISIGHEIRKNHLATKIKKNDICISACTLLLVSGTCRMALGEVGLHQGRLSDNYISKNIMNYVLDYGANYYDTFLKKMNAPQEFIDITHNIPNWDMYYLDKREKNKFGLFSITEDESNYRQEIASRKLGKDKKELTDNLINHKSFFSFGNKPSCSKQFFNDQLEANVNHLSDEFTDDNFEIYSDKQFYVRLDDKGNPILENSIIKEHYSNKIPLEKGVNYVWEINHYSKGKTIEYKEVTTLAKATEWTFSNKDKNYQISISKDKKQATKIVKQENIGIIMNGWGLDPKYDTKGPIKIEIFVNEKLVKTFNYEVY